MSHFLPKPHTSTSTNGVIPKLRHFTWQVNRMFNGLKTSPKGMTGILLAVMLAGCISLVALARERTAKNDATTGGSSNSAAKSEAIPAKPGKKAEAAAAKKATVAAKEKSEAAVDAKEEKEAAEPAPPKPKPQGFQNSTGQTPIESEEEQENGEMIRERAKWFHDQRAYPNKHIPAGALQKAFQQRDLMKQQQKAAATQAQAGSNAVISFPGDALWHLTGPQPVDVPFGFNGGSPTASGRVNAIAVDTTDATGNTVYIGGAAGGVWKTTDGGGHWAAMTDAEPSLAVGAIAIDPNNHLNIYVGTGEENFNGDAFFGVGVLKSINGGTSWTQQGASTFVGPFNSVVGAARIGAIAVDPNNSSVILAGVAFGDQGSPSGIYRSADAGSTWNLVQGGDAGTAVVFDPVVSAKTAYAALGFPGGDTNNGIYKSVDEGATWTKLTGAVLPASTSMGRITLAFAPSTTGNTAVIYAAIADASTGSSTLLGLFKTMDGGSTWTKLTNAPNFCNSLTPGTGQCFYDMAIGVHPTIPNVVVVGGAAFTDNFTSLFETTDGGTTWTGTGANDFSGVQGSTHPHVDTHAIVFTPLIVGNSNRPILYVGNDGGIWSTNNPVQGTLPPPWADLNGTDLNGTLAITQFYPGPSAGIGDENYGFGGTQDNDIEVFSGTPNWTNVLACGDGGFTAIDAKIPTTVYVGCDEFAGHVVRKSVFNGAVLPGPSQSFAPADSGITKEQMEFISPLVVDENNPSTLYFGTCRIWQTFDGATTWNQVTGDLAGTNTFGAPCGGAGDITTIDVPEKTSSSIVFAGTSNGKVWRTGPVTSWTEIDGGLLPTRHITAVRGRRGDTTGNIAYVAFSGFDCGGSCDPKTGHVFKTTDGGTTWLNITGDLPDAPVNDIIVYHQGTFVFDALYIATDEGVFSCPDPESATPCKNWTVVGDGLPNAPVLGLAMRRSSRILRAFTHGRSAWHIQLTDVQIPPFTAISSVTPGAVNVGDATTQVIVTGINFSANTVVQFDGLRTGLTQVVNSTTQITLTVNSSLFTDGHVFQVTVFDPQGSDTSSLPFTVMNPILTATNMTPNNTTAYTPVNLTFTGTRFVSSSNGGGGTLVTFNNIPLTGGTASAGGTSFSVQVPAFLLTTVGPATVTITNPLPGGGPTPAISFAFTINPGTIVINPSPILLFAPLGTTSTPVTNVAVINSSAAPATITAQGIAGANLLNFSFATPTAGTSCNFPPSGQSGVGTITLAANGGTCNFGITYTAGNPPGNAVSNATLSVTDTASGSPQTAPIQGTPLPSTVVLLPVNFGGVGIGTTSPTMNATLINGTSSPVSVTSAFSISGTNQGDFHIVPFVSNGDTNSACPSSIPFALPAAPTPGFSCDVTLTFTPSLLPAGAESANLNVTASVPVTTLTPNLTGTGIEITSISPSIVATGGPAFTLTVNGGGFAPSAVVNVSSINGTNVLPRLTTFVSANQLLASIPASDIATTGSLAITVTTPVPGGTTSEPKTLVVAQALVATNDNINFALNASTTPARITQDTTQATTDTGGVADPTPPCGSGSKAKSVWYTFTAPANGRVIADTRFSSYTTIASAWTGTVGSLVAVPGACATGNVAGTIPASLLGFNVTSGTKYFVMVTDATTGTSAVGGTLTASLDFQATAPANDPFASATAIAAAPFTTTENTIQATANTGAADPVPSCTVGAPGLAASGQGNSVWFKFTAPSNGTITADTLTSPYDTILTAVTGVPGSFTEVACNNDAAVGIAQSQVSFAATASTTYSFMVSSFLGDGGTTNFHLTFSGAATPSISFSPTSVPFGNQQVGTTSAVMNVTVTNNDSNGAALHITGTSIAGGNSLDFILVGPSIAGTACPIGVGALTLAQGTSCVMGIQFKPGASGARNSNFNVTDDAAASPQSVPLTGTGTQPSISFNPTPLNFGNQQVGTTSTTMNVTVTNNTGNGDPLHITGTSIAGGTNTLDFTLVAATIGGTPCPNGVGALTLAQGASCVIGIQFKPSVNGAENSNFTVTDDAAASPQSVPLNGTGTQPSISFNPTPVNFGSVTQGTTSTTMNVTVTNNTANGDPLHITGTSIAGGTNTLDFTLVAATIGGTPCPNGVGALTLAQGASCVIGIQFKPSTVGAENSNFDVTDDASGSPQSVPLNGTGIAAVLSASLTPSPVPFGNQRVNTTGAAVTVTLTNTGTGTVTLAAANAVTITGTNTADFAIAAGTTCANSTVLTAPSGACLIKLTFKPGASGARTATINVSDNAAGSPQSATLNGTGIAPIATVTPSPLPFGNQRKGTTSAALTVTVKNTGTDTLNLAAASAVVISGANAADFANAAGTTCVNSTALAPAASCIVNVTFTPSTAAAEAATLTITDDSNAVAGSAQPVSLTGTGTVPVASLAPANIPFGNQNTGTSSATTDVTLTNTGLASMNITSITLTGTDTTQFTLGAPTTGTACPFGASNLTAGANCKVGVKFAPTTTGAKSASVSFADDAAGSPQTVPLTGTGITGTIGFSPSPVNFGNQHTGTTSAATTVTVTNSGGAAVHLAAANAVTFGGANPGDFAAAAGTTCANNLTLNPSPGPGNTCVVNVTFTPGATGPRAGTLLLADDAAGSPQTANLTGTGTAPAVTFAPTNVPFGNQKVGTTSATTDVTIANSGTATLNITSITLTGTDPTQFTLGAPTSGTACPLGASALNAGANCKVGVQFAPTTAGAKGANVSVADDATASPQTAPLTGTGTVPGVTLAPTNVAFGNQKVGTTSTTTDVTITNSGLAQLNITSITLTGVDAGQYTIGAPTSGTACPLGASNLAAGANCKVGVAFAPTSAGLKNANVSVADDASGSPQTVPLSGTGTVPGVTFAPVNVPFGNQRVGTTSAKTDVTITNSGLAQLNLNSIALIGTDTSQFALGAPTSGTPCPLLAPSNLAAGANCRVGVTFAPTTSGAKSASLSFTDDAAASPQLVTLSGTGTVPVAGLAPANIPFGNQTIATSSATTDVTLTNTGLAQLNLTSITLTGTDTTQFTLGAPTSGTACPLGASNLAAGANCKVGVKFSPTTTGAKSASVSFADDAVGSPQTVPLTGMGVTATVTLNPALAFGNQRKGTSSAAMTVTLTNTGGVAVHLVAANSITFSGANAADFSKAPPSSGTPCADGATVAASGGACTIGVVFSPTTAGAEAATLIVADDAPGSPQTDNLTGTGVFPQATPLPNPVNFNNQVINTTSGSMTVTLTNGGTDVLHLAAANAVVIGGTNPGDFATAAGTTCTNGATVNAGANCVINVTFTPSALNARTATVTITDDANPTNQVVTLNGTGTNPAPTITMLNPSSATAGGAGFPLTVNGSAFVSGAVVNFNGAAKATVFVSATQLTATILAADITAGGMVNVTVTNPAPGGGTSAAAVFTINNPVPAITSLVPNSATAGGAAFILTVNGTGFVTNQSVVKFNGSTKTTTVVSPTQATAPITPADIATAGIFPVTVTNAAPGGGVSAPPTNFTVNNPVPTLTSIAPTSAIAGGTSFTLTLTGTNFVAGSTVKFGTNPALTPTSQTAAQIQVTVPAADIATAGSVNVTVTNPAPGGGTTGAQTFTINNPVPTITSLVPSSATVGGAAFVLTVNGTNFVATSVVNFNGAARVTTFKSATQLTAAILATDIVAAGVVNVTVTNPLPGGGTSTASPFTINNPQPVITSLSPSSAAAGGAAFTLTINGSSFITGAKVDFGADKGLTPTSVAAGVIKVTIPAADIATGGTPNVVVNNPAPAVGPSAPSPFTVNNPVPTLTGATVNGNNHISGGAAFNLTATGTLFVSTSTINFNGKAEPTTFVSATQVTAAVPATDAATAGTFPVTVTNPAPAGGTTAAVNFTIDGFTVSGPATTTVKAGQQAMIQISVKPTANGFTNAVTSFTVSGLPAHTTAAFSPTSVTPGNTTMTTTLTITTISRGEVPPTAPLDPPVSPLLRLLPVLWLAALLAGLYAMQAVRRAPQLRRYAAIVPLALLLISGAVLAGCAGGKAGTPAGTSQLTITATSGSMSQTTPANSVALTVQ
jgi:hypothetical protein